MKATKHYEGGRIYVYVEEDGVTDCITFDSEQQMRQLAERAGLQRTHISRIEAGKYAVTLETIEAIAEALGMTVDIVDARLSNLAPMKQLV